MTHLHIRPYHPASDEPLLLDLWNAALGDAWPVTPEWFRAVALNDPARQEHLLAEVDGRPVGFALAKLSADSPPRGSILALGVHPEYRRRGVGRALHDAALERLRARGADHFMLGAGASGYFWPGVPADLPGAWPFFQAQGWPEVSRSYDLARALEGYETPSWVWQRVRGLFIEFITAGRADLAVAAVEFVTAEYPAWKPFFAQAAAEGRGGDILLARRVEGGEILGACLVESPYPRWEQRFERPLGAPGCILTAETARGQGIGMALTARATEILQARGSRTSFLGWTWLVDWYGKLGYHVWQEYVMSWK